MKTANSRVSDSLRRIDLSGADTLHKRRYLHRQWLVTNGLGGYASETIAGAVTWRYHGLLVAALPAPHGRVVMLNHLSEYLVRPDGCAIQFGGLEPEKDGEPTMANYLREFRLENQIPVWIYDIEGVRIERRLLMPYLQNTVHVTYRLVTEHSGFSLEIRPGLNFRRIEANLEQTPARAYEIRAVGSRYEVDSHDRFPPLRLTVHGAAASFTQDGGSLRQLVYERDAERGLDSRGSLWSPGYFRINLNTGQPATLIGSTESWHTLEALDPDAAYQTEKERHARLLRIADPRVQHGPAAELVMAADQFIITPAGRVKDAARARAAGDELRSVIAGYHWFTDWGRDTMISLEGLTLTTGRLHEAAWILRTFAQYVRDGLIPNMFPEGQNEGLYHTADATLWFFHAVNRYVQVSKDDSMVADLLPVLREIAAAHLRGTKFGIHVDPTDGLLSQGEEGYQLTWMDAKVGDWVVTPRRGKAVEINALWYNALRLLERWLGDSGDAIGSSEYERHADRARESFNRRFWNPKRRCLFDVVDGDTGDDPAVRPNQLFALSLEFPVLNPERWAEVLEIVEAELVTPVGLRSLSRDHPDYKPKYFGDLRARDAAYHQGTVWAWLIGPFIDAWMKVHPGAKDAARQFLHGFVPQLEEGCVGSINEIFDAEPPYTERGCVAQAWSVAEVLRCFALTA
ncbi:glycogen debranching protein [Opitutaceae bacterium EW11]|nr:glycogen debranching protein [Opitutaceae bacterium EW11]